MIEPEILCAIEAADAALSETCIARMRAAVEQAVRLEGIARAAVNIEVMDAAGVQALNREFRGIDATTDVLSFPANDLQKPLREMLAEGFAPEYEGEYIALGDIAIDQGRAAEQAREYGNTLEEEMAFLSVHGTLHLLGYDHIQPEDERVMRQKQRSALGRERRT